MNGKVALTFTLALFVGTILGVAYVDYKAAQLIGTGKAGADTSAGGSGY